MSFFRNRTDAGRLLARALQRYSNHPDGLVLALPTGGVPVAFEITSALHLPMDVLVVLRLGAPGHEELAMGAVAEGGIRVIDPVVVTELNIGKNAIDTVTMRESRELDRRGRAFRGDREPADVTGRCVILVEDGLVGTSSLKAAVMAIRRRNPERLVIATPALSSTSCEMLATLVDEIVCATAPDPFFEIVSRYAEVSPVSEAVVRSLLAEASRGCAAAQPRGHD